MTLKLLLAGKKITDFQPIKDAFENADATIITATSIALALYLARKNLPDIVIAQEHLTDSEGLSLFYELKNEKELRKIPFILLVPSEQLKQTVAGLPEEYKSKIVSEAKDIHLISVTSRAIKNDDNSDRLKEQILEIFASHSKDTP